MATNTNTTQTLRPATEGQIVHTEFITSDPKNLKTFLEKNFNWKFDTQKMPGGAAGGDYHMFETPGGSRGGVLAPPTPNQTVGTFCYIAVNDVKAKTKQLEKNGAKIVTPPTEIPGMGWFSQFQVKGGPILSCYQGAPGNR
jgi:predicted enzyme related to lactoylglutathione lyase